MAIMVLLMSKKAIFSVESDQQISLAAFTIIGVEDIHLFFLLNLL